MDSCFRSHPSLANFSFIDPNQFSELDMNLLGIISSSADTFFSHQQSSDVVGNFHHAAGDNLQVNIPAIPPRHHRQVQPDIIVAKAEDQTYEPKKRKAGDASRSSSPTSSCPAPIPRKGKKVKVKVNKEEEREVIHVRARRGQATDSHSLAERVRRGKINERLRCLQDIVPGCYKTMGMTMMLDEIITYVHSLQNQVEFLSMKLTAASSFHDFNSDTNIIEMMQRASGEEVQEMEKLMREGYGGGSSCFDSTTTTSWPQ